MSRILKLNSEIIKKEFIFILFTIFLTTIDTQKLLKTCIVAPIGNEYLKSWLTVFKFYSISIFVTYMLASIVFFAKKIWIKYLLYLIPLSLFIINYFLKENFGNALDPSYFIIIGETNYNETSEFLKAFLFTWFGLKLSIITIIIVGSIYIAEKLYDKLTLPPPNLQSYVNLSIFSRLKHIIIIFITIFVLCGLYNISYLRGLLKCKSLQDIDNWSSLYNEYYFDYYTRTIYSLYAPIAVSNEINRSIESTYTACKSILPRVVNTEHLNIILVIGESYIKSHASIYGYKLNTTPFLEKELKNGNLFVFHNVITPYNTTSLAIKNMLSCNNLSKHEQWQDYPFFPALFKSFGYNVYFWDNQNKVGQHSDFTLNSYLSNVAIKKISYSDYNKNVYRYDNELIQNFWKQKMYSKADNLIIFHLWGQHLEAKERYPHINAFNRFNINMYRFRNERWITKSIKEEISEYDNATLYNDYVLSQIINKYRSYNAILIYLSDHGEEIYDYRNSKGRKNIPINKNLLESQYEIPFVIWCSDTYIKNNPKVIFSIKRSLYKPFKSDNLCHLLFHIGKVKTKYYKEEDDLLSEKYRCLKRIVYNKINFDKYVVN